LYLKPPSAGGLCDGVMMMAVGGMLRGPAVVGEDGVGNHGRRRGEVVALDDGGDAVGREDFQRGALAAAERAWVSLPR